MPFFCYVAHIGRYLLAHSRHRSTTEKEEQREQNDFLFFSPYYRCDSAMSGPPPSWQFACAAYIPLLTANLSVVGSGLIIYSMLVVGRQTKLRKPHNRLLLAMSIYQNIVLQTCQFMT